MKAAWRVLIPYFSVKSIHIMKNNVFAWALCAAVAISSPAWSQKFKPLDKSPMDLAAYVGAQGNVRVYYSRPQLNNRNLETLAPEGKVWRTGANEATVIEFTKDLKIQGKTIPKGRYGLFTIPGKENWTIIFNKDADQWGTYNYDPKKDVARVTAPATTSDESLDVFSLVFSETGTLHLGWGTTRVSLDIKM